MCLFHFWFSFKAQREIKTEKEGKLRLAKFIRMKNCVNGMSRCQSKENSLSGQLFWEIQKNCEVFLTKIQTYITSPCTNLVLGNLTPFV